MKYWKSVKLKQRVVKYSDVMEIACFFEELAKEQGGSCSFQAHFRDGTSINDHYAAMFEDGYFHRRDISWIKYEYTSENYANSIELHLEPVLLFSAESNGYDIASNDETWFNATLGKLNELLSGIRKINFFRKLFCLPWIPLTYVALQVLLFGVMPLFGFQFGERPMTADGMPDASVFFIPASAFFILRFAVFALFTVGVCLLYPEVEFSLGATRYERRVKARKVVAWSLGTILIPIALSCIM